MKEILTIRIPWGKAEKGDVHYEYTVGFGYGDLGLCKEIIEHAPGHCEVFFEKEFISYYKGLITRGTYETKE